MGKADDGVQPAGDIPPARWATPGVAGEAGELLVEVEQLASRFVSDHAFDSMGDRLVAMRQFIDQLEAAWLSECAAFDQAGLAADEGAVTLASWLRHRCHLAPGEASSRAHVAAAITSGPLQATGGAMRDGSVSWRHAATIEATLKDVPVEHRSAAEAALQEPAKSLDPSLLRRVGAELLHRLDVDRAEERAVRRLERRGLTCSTTFDGMVAINGLLDPLSGATVMTALDAKTQPTRTTETPDDFRSGPQRRADAMTDICREWLELGDSPQVGGQRPHVSVIVDLATLRKEAGSSPGQLSWVGPTTANETQLISCDSVVSRVVMDGPSQVLDVGRATRTIPPAVRRAVIARDRNCVSPGCYRPPEHCDVHHIQFWESGGATAVANLVLVCRRHHRYVHQKGWQVRRKPNGAMTLAP